VIGFIAHRSNLYVSFGFLAMLLVALICNRQVCV
jgi:hypothetical protein